MNTTKFVIKIYERIQTHVTITIVFRIFESNNGSKISEIAKEKTIHINYIQFRHMHLQKLYDNRF